MKSPTILAMLCFLVFSNHSQADSSLPDCRMGKFSPEDLAMKVYAPDTNAAAVVLANQEYISYIYSDIPNHPVRLQMDVFRRVKILNKNGYDYANFEIPLYVDNSQKDVIVGLTATTYNLSDGKAVSSDLVKKNMFEEQEDKNHVVEKFAMPDVREGSIIEVKYSIQSDFLADIPEWFFQENIPVRFSDFTIEYPEFCFFNVVTHGELRFNAIEQSVTKVPSFENATDTRAYLLTDNITSGKGFNDNISRYIAINIPAFKKEPFIKSELNYLSRVRYELASISLPGSFAENYSMDWDAVAVQLLENSDFGDQLKSQGLLNSVVTEACGSERDPMQKLLLIFNYVKQNVTWNGEKSLFAATSVRDVLKAKKGNSADINLLLIDLLNTAGVKAYPLIIRTAELGSPTLFSPSISSFNYVVAVAQLDTDNFFLDATSPYNPINQLPEHCLNYTGMLLQDLGEQNGNHQVKTLQVDLIPGNSSREIVNYSLKLSDDGSLIGKVDEKYTNYYALNFREDYKIAKDQEEFIKDLEQSNPGLEIDSLSLQDFDDAEQPVKAEYKVSIQNKVQQMGNMLAIPSSLFETEDESDYRLENRKYPVEYPFPYEKDYVIKIDLPDGYAIDSLPKPIIYSLPDGAGRFVYSVSSLGSSVLIVGKLVMAKTLFLPADYGDLRAFFNHVIQKQSEIILVKKS